MKRAGKRGSLNLRVLDCQRRNVNSANNAKGGLAAAAA